LVPSGIGTGIFGLNSGLERRISKTSGPILVQQSIPLANVANVLQVRPVECDMRRSIAGGVTETDQVNMDPNDVDRKILAQSQLHGARAGYGYSTIIIALLLSKFVG